MTEAIVNRLKAAHFEPPVERYVYAHAGHRAGRPEIVPTWHGELHHPVSGRVENLGGTPQGDAESSIDGIARVLAFLEASLKGASPAAMPAQAPSPAAPAPAPSATNQ
jgi:hypothetical protein